MVRKLSNIWISTQKILPYFIFVIISFSFSEVFADQTSLELSEGMEKSIQQLPQTKAWIKQFFKKRNEIQEKYGTDFAVIINSQVQSALYAKENQGKSRAAWYWNVALEQRLWKGAFFDFEFEGGYNKGINKLLPTFSVFNSDAGEPAHFYVTNAYLKQDLFHGKASFTAGRLDLSDWFDTNAVANSSDEQFLSTSLVNSLNIPFPQKGLGAMMNFRPSEWSYFQFGVSDAESIVTRVGLDDAFKGTFMIGEFGISPKINARQGNYRFIFHSNRQKLDLINSEGFIRRDYGVALSFDQQVTDRVTLFCRYSFADQRVRDIKHFWSIGGQIVEPIRGRKDDVFGIGLAQSILGSDYRRANEAVSAETMYEIYYNLSPCPFVEIVPNFQIVTHPDGEKDSSCSIVLGTRVVIIF